MRSWDEKPEREEWVDREGRRKGGEICVISSWSSPRLAECDSASLPASACRQLRPTRRTATKPSTSSNERMLSITLEEGATSYPPWQATNVSPSTTPGRPLRDTSPLPSVVLQACFRYSSSSLCPSSCSAADPLQELRHGVGGGGSRGACRPSARDGGRVSVKVMSSLGLQIRHGREGGEAVGSLPAH